MPSTWAIDAEMHSVWVRLGVSTRVTMTVSEPEPPTIVSGPGPGARAPFHVDIVGETAGPLVLASGVPIDVQRSIDTVEASDVVIVPSVLLRPAGWKKGRYPRLTEWQVVRDSVDPHGRWASDQSRRLQLTGWRRELCAQAVVGLHTLG